MRFEMFPRRKEPIDTTTPPAEIVILDRKTHKWRDLKKRGVLEVFDTAFKGHHLDQFSHLALRLSMMNKKNTVILQTNTNNDIIGFTCASPEREKTAYVGATAIHPDYQHRGLIWGLLDSLESTLVEKGYTQAEAETIDKNGWPDALQKHYGDRLVKTGENKIHDQRIVNFTLQLKNNP